MPGFLAGVVEARPKHDCKYFVRFRVMFAARWRSGLTIEAMKALRCLVAVLGVFAVVGQGFAFPDAKQIVYARLFKKNITGARSRWDMKIFDDGTVTINEKAADPLKPEDFDKLKTLIGETDFASIMKTKSTEGYASSKGGIDLEISVHLDKTRAMVASWMHDIDRKALFFKFMDELMAKYKPSWERMGRGGG